MRKLWIVLMISGLALQGYTQETNDKKQPTTVGIHLKKNIKNPQPEIYVDGKRFEFALELIDPDKIESVEVLKGERALSGYQAENGVILISTKMAQDDSDSQQATDQAADGASTLPVIIIDGKRSTKKVLDTLSPDTIQEVNIYREGPMIEKYNAPAGVILVTTKGG